MTYIESGNAKFIGESFRLLTTTEKAWWKATVGRLMLLVKKIFWYSVGLYSSRLDGIFWLGCTPSQLT